MKILGADPTNMPGCTPKCRLVNSFDDETPRRWIFNAADQTVRPDQPTLGGRVADTLFTMCPVCHKIEVTGTAVPASEAEVDKNVPKAPHYMKLTAIKMLSATCP